jgi:hypothetical protein
LLERQVQQERKNLPRGVSYWSLLSRPTHQQYYLQHEQEKLFATKLPNIKKVLKHIAVTEQVRTGRVLSTIENRATVYPESVNARKLGVAKVIVSNRPLNLHPETSKALKSLGIKPPTKPKQ